MEIMTSSLTGTDMAAIKTHGITAAHQVTSNEETTTEENRETGDIVHLSDIGKMISTTMRMAHDGDTKAQAFLSDLEQGLECGRLDIEALAGAAPENLQSAMHKQGIDLMEPLQKVADFAASMLSSAA